MGNFMRKWINKDEPPAIENSQKLYKKRVSSSMGGTTSTKEHTTGKGKHCKRKTRQNTVNKRKKMETGHDMSPSPVWETGMDTDDTDHYSDDSQEGRYWAGAYNTRRQVSATQKLKNRLKLVSKWSQQDTKAYREGYPGKPDNETQKDNLLFYTNSIASKPDGDKIDDMLTHWYGDYDKLERHHGYIQWLFPIREAGMNWYSQELQIHEAQAISADPAARKRFIAAYKMMLDFYGMKLKDPETGELERAENWKERLEFLNRSYHNYLRITRILKALGELGFEHMKAPCVRFMLQEAIYEQTIPNAAKSCVEYWVHTLRNQAERDAILEEVKTFVESDDDFSNPSSPQSDTSLPQSGTQSPTKTDPSTSAESSTQSKPTPSSTESVAPSSSTQTQPSSSDEQSNLNTSDNLHNENGKAAASSCDNAQQESEPIDIFVEDALESNSKVQSPEISIVSNTEEKSTASSTDDDKVEQVKTDKDDTKPVDSHL